MLRKMKILSIFGLLFWLTFPINQAGAFELYRITRESVAVFYETPLRTSAEEVIHIFPHVKKNLETIFQWPLDSKPTIILIKNSRDFQRIAENPLTVAFAVPEKDLIVIDHSKTVIRPFTLENTIKHELCHLLLHQHIDTENLPRWFDEGICQWVSDGLADIIMNQKRSVLNRAALKGTYIPIASLKNGFPYDATSLVLAYEESRSFIDYLINRFSKDEMLKVLGRMKQGHNAENAIREVLSLSLEELENDWHRNLRRRITWFTILSYHINEILFALTALITILTFIKIIFRKRAYLKEYDGDVSSTQ